MGKPGKAAARKSLKCTINRTDRKIDVAAAFQARRAGMTLQEIATLQGATKQAVSVALKKFEALLGASASVPDDNGMADLLRGAAIVHVLDSVQPKKRAKMDGKAHAIAAAALIDKQRLVSGQSTNNTSVFFHVVAEAPDLPGQTTTSSGEGYSEDTGVREIK